MLKTLPRHLSCGRYRVIAVSDRSMRIAIDDQTFDLPWSCVRGISAGCTALAGIGHLALALDIEIDAAERVLIVTEADRIWASFTQILPIVFSQVPSVTSWGPLALTSCGPVSLYDRPHAEPHERDLGLAGLH